MYNRNNILNLRVRRGGVAEYVIKAVHCWEIEAKHIGGRTYFIPTETALSCLNNGKWQVVNTSSVVNNTYKFY